MMIKIKWVGLMWMALMLTGCGGLGTIPADKQDYIGTWYGQYIVLSISADVKVDYKYKKGNTSKSISAPILEFMGDDFKVGAFGIDTVFQVSTKPYLEDGIWKMVVDDQLVMRKDTENGFAI